MTEKMHELPSSLNRKEKQVCRSVLYNSGGISPNTPDVFHVPRASFLSFYLTVTCFAGGSGKTNGEQKSIQY